MKASFAGGIAACALSFAAIASDDPAEAGRRLFAGETEVRGTVAGHAEALPAIASRCANCHATAPGIGSATRAGAASTPSFAPSLDRRYLLDPVARRGGPASRYDAASFCRVLRTGVDPAYVLVARAMPRYALTDEACAALWAHLAGRR